MEIIRKMKRYRYMLLAATLLLSGCSQAEKPETESAASSVAESSVAESSVAESSAETQSPANSVVFAENGLFQLTEDQTYMYDLDGDGSDESIRYLTTNMNDDYRLAQIYINDTLLYANEEGYGFSFDVFLTDLDRQDSQCELCIYATVESDTVQALTFLSYENDTITELAELAGREVLGGAGTYYRGQIHDVKSDGTLILVIDTPIYGNMFGCYHVPVSFRLEGHELQEIEQDYYTFPSYQPEYWDGYIVGSSFTAMTEPGGSTAAFTAEVGEIMEFDGICVRGEDFYGRVTNSDGVSGWLIDLDDLFPGEEGAYFIEVPAWG